MKRLVSLSVLTLVFGFIPQAAIAQPTTTIEQFKNVTDTLSDIDLCGDLYDVTLTYNGVIQSTEFPDGRTEVHVTIAGSLVAELVAGDGPIYTGRYTEVFGFRLNQANGSFTGAIEIVAKGSDGSKLRLSSLIHINQTAAGGEIAFEKGHCA